MYLAMGILVALLEREVSGEGQWVRTSLLEAQIAMLDFQATRWLIGKEVPPQAGNDHPTGIPTGVFPTKDGHMNIAASNQHIFKRLCDALGAEDVYNNPDFATGKLRSKNRKACNAALGEYTKTKTTAEWIERLNAHSVPCGPIYKMNEVFEDEQVKHLGMAADVRSPKLGDLKVVRNAVSLSRTPHRIAASTPERGEHNDEVLREVGYSDAEIASLRERKVV
jgi:formyl-CoA transferase